MLALTFSASWPVGEPVKLVLRREQMFGSVGHRAPTRQTLRTGANRDGALAAIDRHPLLKILNAPSGTGMVPALSAVREP